MAAAESFGQQVLSHLYSLQQCLILICVCVSLICSSQILNADMAAAEPFGQQALSQLDSQIAEVEDMLSYCNDVLNTGGCSVKRKVCMWRVLFYSASVFWICVCMLSYCNYVLNRCVWPAVFLMCVCAYVYVFLSSD